MDADPANLGRVCFLTEKYKNNTAGSSLFAVPIGLPV
jgi:hypothetical protein